MKLNKEQKQFLFKNCYVDAQCLDACVEQGWQNYFIKCFDWKLEDIDRRTVGERQYYGHLRLIDKDDKEIAYDILIIFQNNDYEELLKLKK